MKFLCYLSVLCCLACSSSHPVSAGYVGITATITALAMHHDFRDATAMSTDQFGNAYIVESSNNSIVKISIKGDSLHSLSGFGDDHYQFNDPSGIDAHLTNAIFVSDRFNHRIEQYNKDFTYTGTLYTRENIDRSTRFGYPAAVAVDDGGNIYVADGENKRVVKARSDYSIERTIGGFSDATRPEAILSNPVALAIDNQQHLIVLDNGGTSLVEYDNLGNFISRISLPGMVRSISSWGGKIYALAADQPFVYLFQSGTLMTQGAWKIVRSDTSDTSSFESFVYQTKACYLLSRHTIYLCITGVGDTILH